MVKAQCASLDPAAGEMALRAVDVRSGGAVRKSSTPSVTSALTSQPSEQLEIQLYLSKLKELVPHMPRNRKVSKLEVIQHVIDYICDLQTALESRPNRQVSTPASAVMASLMAGASSPRQPLGLLPPNPNAVANTCAAQESSQDADKTMSDCDVRTVPC